VTDTFEVTQVVQQLVLMLELHR